MEKNDLLITLKVSDLKHLITQAVSDGISEYKALETPPEQHRLPIRLPRVVELTGMRPNTLYQLIHQNSIPHHKRTGSKFVYFFEDEIVSWVLDKNKEKDHGCD